MKQNVLFALCFSILALSARADGKSETNPVTQIAASICGTTLPEINTNITAGIVAGASAYKFRVSNLQPDNSTLTQTVTSPLRVFNLAQLGTFAFGTVYTIDVSVKINNVWQLYGPACTVTSPSPVASISSTQCGSVIASLNDPIYSTLINFAAGYRYKLTNLSNPTEEFIIDRPLREFRFSLFPFHASTTYAVQVAVKNLDGTYLDYGPVCPVTSPSMTTKIGFQFCGHTVNTFSDYVYADLITGAQAYRFKVTDLATGTVEVVDRPLRSFCLTMLSNVTYGTGYKIEVAVKDPAGDFQAFGPFCTIFTPIASTPKIQESQCEMAASNAVEAIYADDFPNATAYKFKLYNTTLGYTQVVTRSVRYFNLNMFSGLAPGTNYTIKVAAKVNGYYTAYGKPCSVTTPSGMAARNPHQKLQEDMTFMPIVYPNPFSDSFSIATQSDPDAEVSVAVYDMTGRLLDKKKMLTIDLEEMTLGAAYPAGVYNAVMTLGGMTRTVRVVKR